MLAAVVVVVMGMGEKSWPEYPEAISSFGAAIAGDWIYVDGGHIGKSHDHSFQNLSRGFRRINVKNPSQWEDLPARLPVQGHALVAHGEAVIRVGGMVAKNAAGSPAEMHSQTDVARFDPKTKKWQPLAPLPMPRSSHDAVVVGDTLFVVGGWQLAGSSAGTWDVGALSLDLANPEAKWQKLPDPEFKRRALSCVAMNDRVYVLGGINDMRDVVMTLSVYDIKSKIWSEGPDLPGKGMNGFGAQMAVAGGRLYAGGMDGHVYQLSSDGQKWVEVAKLKKPSFFHRLIAISENEILAIGGAGNDGHLSRVEVLKVGPSAIKAN